VSRHAQDRSTGPPSATRFRVFETRLADRPAPASFSERELDALPDPVRRCLEASISPGTPLARSARFRMRGSIKLGKRWLPFRARQILAPHHGRAWAARVAGVVAGSDRYADGRGTMDWKLLGLLRIVHAEGPDTSRSTAGRVGAESVWVPTTLLPRFGVSWAAPDPHHIAATYVLDDTELEVRYELDDHNRVLSAVLNRWGDPDNTGAHAYHPFGFEATGYTTFDGVTLPSAGRGGWFFGTDRWGDGEFMRYEIIDYRLVP
jgi:Family of unknown function (DUF6544)